MAEKDPINMNDIAKEIDEILDTKLADMKKDIVDSVVKSLTIRLDTLNLTMESNFEAVNHRIENIESKMKSSEEKDMIIMIKNLQVIDQNDTKGVEDLFKHLAIGNVKPSSVRRLMYNKSLQYGDSNMAVDGAVGGEMENVSNVIQVSMLCKDDKMKVLKAKHRLKNSDCYQNVFLEAYKSYQERSMENNMRKIAKSIPTLKYSKGRLIHNK